MHLRLLLPAALIGLTGCVSALDPNDPPRGDREDTKLSQAYRQRVAPLETRPTHGLDVQLDIDVIECDAEGSGAVDVAFNPGEEDLHFPAGSETLSLNGLRVGLAGRQFFGAMSGGAGSGSVRRRLSETLLVQNTTAGAFRLAGVQTAPIVLSYCGRSHAMKTLPISEATCRIEVSPRRMPSGEIKLRLLPVLSYRDAANGPQTLSFPDLAAEAIVRDGESVLVGSVPAAATTIGALFLRPGGEGSVVRTAYLITPKLRE